MRYREVECAAQRGDSNDSRMQRAATDQPKLLRLSPIPRFCSSALPSPLVLLIPRHQSPSSLAFPAVSDHRNQRSSSQQRRMRIRSKQRMNSTRAMVKSRCLPKNVVLLTVMLDQQSKERDPHTRSTAPSSFFSWLWRACSPFRKLFELTPLVLAIPRL